jgi:hypothetical protein
VFLDLNGDGRQEPGEPPLAGRTVFLDQAGDGSLAPGSPEVVTGQDGSFTLSGEGQLRQFLFPGDFDDGQGTPTRLNSTLTIIPPVSDLYVHGATPQEAFVRSTYHGVLGRLASDEEAQQWVARMASGMTQAQVAAAIWGSAEHRLGQIDAYYRYYLHRAGEEAGRQAHLAELMSGATEEEVVTGFLSSAEYQSLHPDAKSFVDDLYVVLLGRDRGQGEAPQYEAQVGQLGRAAFVRAFLDQPEARLRAIDGFYVGLLNREGEEAGRQNWLAGLGAGSQTYGTVAMQFLVLPEFLARSASA